jgi:hypothetical protein
VIAVLLALVAGCGGTEEEKGDGSTPTQEEKAPLGVCTAAADPETDPACAECVEKWVCADCSEVAMAFLDCLDLADAEGCNGDAACEAERCSGELQDNQDCRLYVCADVQTHCW